MAIKAGGFQQWEITFVRRDNTSHKGTIEVRAETAEGALKAFYLLINKTAIIAITSIKELS